MPSELKTSLGTEIQNQLVPEITSWDYKLGQDTTTVAGCHNGYVPNFAHAPIPKWQPTTALARTAKAVQLGVKSAFCETSSP